STAAIGNIGSGGPQHPIGSVISATMYAKRAERTIVTFHGYDTASYTAYGYDPGAIFDLAAGTFIARGNATASMTPLGDGYILNITYTRLVTGYDYFYYALAQGNDTSSYLTAYTGIVGDGAYLSNKIFWTLNGVTSYVEDITAYPTNVTVHYVANTALPSATAIASADVSTVGTSINIGEITILSVDDYGNANLLCSQSTTLSQTATI